MEMSMVMTFGSFTDYQLELLFSSWNITEKWQFALSWLMVMFAVIFYHGLKYNIAKLEDTMHQAYYKKLSINSDGEGVSIENDKELDLQKKLINTNVNDSPIFSLQMTDFFKIRFLHALGSSLNYGVGGNLNIKLYIFHQLSVSIYLSNKLSN